MVTDPADPPPDEAAPAEGEPGEPRALRWSVQARLRFIEARLFWDGTLNRSDLMTEFGVSVPQAAADLKRYTTLAPGNMIYDTSARRYRAAPGFTPAFGMPDAEAWLREGLAAEPPWLPPVERVPLPVRLVDPQALRQVVAAARAVQRIGILYQSMSRDGPTWREVSPRAVVTDGLRWHCRGFCHRDLRWEDFLFPRMIDLGPPVPETGTLPEDAAWDRLVGVRLRPAARLRPAQAEVVARDWAMTLADDGQPERVIEVREALLFYLWRRLRLDHEDGLVQVVNRAAIQSLLPAVVRSPAQDAG